MLVIVSKRARGCHYFEAILYNQNTIKMSGDTILQGVFNDEMTMSLLNMLKERGSSFLIQLKNICYQNNGSEYVHQNFLLGLDQVASWGDDVIAEEVKAIRTMDSAVDQKYICVVKHYIKKYFENFPRREYPNIQVPAFPVFVKTFYVALCNDHVVRSMKIFESSSRDFAFTFVNAMRLALSSSLQGPINEMLKDALTNPQPRGSNNDYHHQYIQTNNHQQPNPHHNHKSYNNNSQQPPNTPYSKNRSINNNNTSSSETTNPEINEALHQIISANSASSADNQQQQQQLFDMHGSSYHNIKTPNPNNLFQNYVISSANAAAAAAAASQQRPVDTVSTSSSSSSSHTTEHSSSSTKNDDEESDSNTTDTTTETVRIITVPGPVSVKNQQQYSNNNTIDAEPSSSQFKKAALLQPPRSLSSSVNNYGSTAAAAALMRTPNTVAAAADSAAVSKQHQQQYYTNTPQNTAASAANISRMALQKSHASAASVVNTPHSGITSVRK